MIYDKDGYAIMQDVQMNRIVITLPQTNETLTNSVSSVSNRKKKLTGEDEIVLLMLVKAMYERGE